MIEKTQKPTLEEVLALSFSNANTFKSLIDNYAEVSTDLILAHNLCCHYTNIDELDGRHQAAIQRLWFVIEAIIQEGFKNKSNE